MDYSPIMQHAIGPQSGSSRIEVPMLDGAAPRERADAARNRARILAAAQRLFDERGIAGVTMDDVVAAAGVGKGTLFRRFTDKRGLAVALLDEHERALQHRILTGPPPLGPGAAPADRLGAFVAAYLAYVDEQLDLVLMSETSAPGARFRTGAHAFWRHHCRLLLRPLVADVDLRADVLLAALTAEQLRHWLHDRGRDRTALAAALVAFAVCDAG